MGTVHCGEYMSAYINKVVAPLKENVILPIF